MSAVYHYCNQFEKILPVNNIKNQFPRKQKIYKQTQPIAIGTADSISFEINKKPVCFDPNITNSPSTVFIQNLNTRINEYYSDNIIYANNSRRDRTNSMDLLICKGI